MLGDKLVVIHDDGSFNESFVEQKAKDIITILDKYKESI